jgi:hypothetical protein
LKQALRSELEAKELLNKALMDQLERAQHNPSAVDSAGSPSEVSSLIPYLSEHQSLLLKRLVAYVVAFVRVGSEGEAGLRHLAELLELPALVLPETTEFVVASPTGKSFAAGRPSIVTASSAQLQDSAHLMQQLDDLKKRCMMLQTALENSKSEFEFTQRDFTTKIVEMEVGSLHAHVFSFLVGGTQCLVCSDNWKRKTTH